jgi:CRISPR-associated protein Csx17
MTRLPLPGCRPEPLLSYLKALGIFRLVAEQADKTARAAWEDDVFILHTTLSEAELVEFFIHKYYPTPIVVPWRSAYFAEYQSPARKKKRSKLKVFADAPTEDKGLSAFLATKSARLQPYRDTIAACLATLSKLGVTTKADLGKRKAQVLNALRAELPDAIVPWLDVAFALDAGADKAVFNTLLGSGGGSDGRANFADNFMQNVWDALPDFDSQRKGSRKVDTEALLRQSMLGAATNGLLIGRTSALFDSGAVGGPNATQGMEREALGNPWNFIFGLEGALCLAGATSRRLNASRSAGAFPFTVRSRAVGSGTFNVDKESGQKEVWLPLWSRSMALAELNLLFSEGRAEVRRKPAQNGLDFSRAVANYGVDRGIAAFARYALVKGRVGGDNYNTASALGRFVVQAQPAADLLNEVDRWLNTARRACDSDDAPARFRATYRHLEAAIFDYCRYGSETRFANVLAALGRMERELGHTGRKPGQVGRSKTNVPPAPPLSLSWLRATNDGTPEWRIATALASIQGAGERLGAFRVHLEPVSSPNKWDENSKMVVWSAADLPRNLAAVLERRLMEAERLNVPSLPLTPRRFARPADVAAFLAGTLDEARLEDLLWGAMLINWSKAGYSPSKVSQEDLQLLPRQFALLKLLFLPEPGLPTAQGKPLWPEASILAALRAGEVNRACELAARRLRASGYTPLPAPVSGGPARRVDWGIGPDPTRLMAALLIPLAQPTPKPNQPPFIAQLVLRQSVTIE